jgi:hypothetical protein
MNTMVYILGVRTRFWPMKSAYPGEHDPSDGQRAARTIRVGREAGPRESWARVVRLTECGNPFTDRHRVGDDPSGEVA